MPCLGENRASLIRTAIKKAGGQSDPIIWEHLGTLHRDDSRQSWEWKRAWHERHGFVPGKNLLTTQDDARGGFDSGAIQATADAINMLP